MVKTALYTNIKYVLLYKKVSHEETSVLKLTQKKPMESKSFEFVS